MTPRIDPALLPESPHLRHERALWANNALWVAGIDEAGRGALAGPVAAAAVVLPQIQSLVLELDGVRDSKKMTPVQRESWAGVIQNTAVTWGIGLASAQEIDQMGISAATRLAATRAVHGLSVYPDYLLVDYINLPELPIPQISLVKGDMRSLSVAAASVLAKTTRDKILSDLDEKYPDYGLASHKGYGTAYHRKTIQQIGPSPIHRMSFAPIRKQVLDSISSS
jgi:ribonuclease HII